MNAVSSDALKWTVMGSDTLCLTEIDCEALECVDMYCVVSKDGVRSVTNINVQRGAVTLCIALRYTLMR
jgi:hypothetical protein